MPEVPLVNEILHSGKLTYGEYGRLFERELSVFFGVDNILVTNTFSNAIMVAVSTLGLTLGDQVIASPMACLASTQPLLAMGLKVLWADIDPKRGTLDPESVKYVIQKNKRVKLIIHNHFCGYPGHIDEINGLGREFGIPVMDDGIEAFGTEYKGSKIGNTGTDISIFSFGAVRFINTIDGGAIIFRDESLYQKAFLVRDSGIDRTKFRDEMGEISIKCDISLIGHNATPNEIQSYVGVQQMNVVAKILDKHRNNASKWDKFFMDKEDLQRINARTDLPNYWVYGVFVPDKVKYLNFFREMGFYASGVHFNNNAYSIFGNQSEMHGVYEFYNKFLALPNGWWVENIKF